MQNAIRAQVFEGFEESNQVSRSSITTYEDVLSPALSRWCQAAVSSSSSLGFSVIIIVIILIVGRLFTNSMDGENRIILNVGGIRQVTGN